MPSENFDNKIKDAAEQHHPNYDEKAWAKMEKLLDKHLPQKKDRRRFIFFLLFLLLAGGGAWLVISKPWQKSNSTLSSTNVNSQPKKEAESATTSEGKATDKSVAGSSSADKTTIAEPEPVIESPAVANVKRDIVTVEDAGNSKQKRKQEVIITNGNAKTSKYKQDKVLPGKINKDDELAIDIESTEKKKKEKNLPQNNTIVSSPGNNDKMLKTDNPKSQPDFPAANGVTQNKTSESKKDIITEPSKTTDNDKKDIAKKSKSKKSNSFFFSVSAGPDVSSVGFDNPGKVKLVAGAGFGYTFKNRWTIRTGFYTGRKIYSAKPDEYKPSVQIPTLYLENISANCKVYEIPLSIAYNFSQTNKHSLFASVGLSSLIMKKETYDYEYKYAGGQPWYYSKTVTNENKHYFSVLTLSGGYQRKINKTFSIATEPYIKLPLTGIGFGNVKLNSAGILFSVTISPFQAGTKK